MKPELKTYIIIIPDCTHPYARFDFEADDWQSTNDLSKAWTVDEPTAYEAACNFRENFGIDQSTFAITATLLSEEIEDQAEYVLTVLSYSHEDGGLVIKSCDTGANGELIVPDTIDGLPVTRIESWAFHGCTGLKSVTLPSSLTTIGNYAFYKCTGLTSVTLPGSVTAIGDGAFSGCTGLKSVTLPSRLTEIGYAAFSGCTGLTSVTLPGSVTAIGYAAFSGCTGLTSVTLPSSITEISYGAFYKCTALKTVTLPSSITDIGAWAFSGCTVLTKSPTV